LLVHALWSSRLDKTDQSDLSSIRIEFSHKSSVDFVVNKHALPTILLKDLIDEVKRRDHDILTTARSITMVRFSILAIVAAISIFDFLFWLGIFLNQNIK